MFVFQHFTFGNFVEFWLTPNFWEGKGQKRLRGIKRNLMKLDGTGKK